MADGPRYKMIGNSWAVPCVRWIFERMDTADKAIQAVGRERPEARRAQGAQSKLDAGTLPRTTSGERHPTNHARRK